MPTIRRRTPTSGWSIGCLASPRFGERWGRHWLDVARYADSAGYETDQDRLNLYYYRDFVIAALERRHAVRPLCTVGNWPATNWRRTIRQAQAATGFLAAGPAIVLTDCRRGNRAELRAISLRRAGRHGLDGRLGAVGSDDGLRPLSRSQIRSDSDARLLPPGRGLWHDRARASDRQAGRENQTHGRGCPQAAPSGLATVADRQGSRCR